VMIIKGSKDSDKKHKERNKVGRGGVVFGLTTSKYRTIGGDAGVML